jgi:thioredoxin reductase (NADPH)
LNKSARYDVAIIGGGPAGLTAGLYAGRAKLKTVLFEKGMFGGQSFMTYHIENYPGFPDPVSGPELASYMETQMKKYDIEVILETVDRIEIVNKAKVLYTAANSYVADTVIIATGVSPRKLDIPGEDKFIGRGVSFCATCDGAFFQNKVVAVIGGGDSAISEALFLTRFASKVYIIHRRDRLRAAKVLQDRALANEKIEFVLNSIPVEVFGRDVVTGLRLKNAKTGEISEIQVNGVFVYIGSSPNSAFASNILELDENGYIKTDENMGTFVPGVFAAGDIRRKSLRQIITAAADGAIAAASCEKYLENSF